MADSVSFRVLTEPFDKMMTDAQRKSDRTTRYALRATGRQVAKAAKPKAPVYSASMTAKGVPYVDKRALVEKGNLRKSIGNVRRMDRIGDTFYLSVGPTAKGKGMTLYAGEGQTVQGNVFRYGNDARKTNVRSTYKDSRGRVRENTSSGQLRGPRFYRQKMEDKYGFMAAGYAVAQAELHEVYEKAVEKSLARYR